MKIETLRKILDKAYQNQKAVCLIGDFGIGKSQIVYEWAEKKAKEENRELVLWHTLSEEQKINILKNPEKYFILVDIKLQSVGDPSKISGIPIIINGDGTHKIVWEPPLFLKVLTSSQAKGVLFLDEINMALPSLQSLAFEITLQRKVGEWKISDNVLIVSAGNPLDVNISANPIPKPLINRLLFIKLEGFEVEDWIRWATKKGIDTRIIAFAQAFRELKKDGEEEFEQSTRPRSYELLSDMIKDTDDLEFIRVCALGYLHETTANKFIKFIQLMHKLDYKKYIENPEEFTKLTNEEKYALITLVAKHTKEIKQEELIKFIEFIANDTVELSAVLLNLIYVEMGEKTARKIVEKLSTKIANRLLEIIVW